MQIACPNSACGAPYTVSQQHLGRQFACRKCGAMIAVDESGARLVSAAMQPAGAAAETNANAAWESSSEVSDVPAYTPAPASMRRTRRRGSTGIPLVDQLLEDPTTLAFAIGSVIVIFFLFMPILDVAKADRRAAAVRAGDMTQQRLDREMQRKQQDGEKLSSSELDEAKNRRQAWEKEKTEMEEDVEQARVDADSGRYWYTWGTMVGFLVLVVAALGYMTPAQPTVRKVTGSIIVCSILLLVFFRILAR